MRVTENQVKEIDSFPLGNFTYLSYEFMLFALQLQMNVRQLKQLFSFWHVFAQLRSKCP